MNLSANKFFVTGSSDDESIMQQEFAAILSCFHSLLLVEIGLANGSCLDLISVQSRLSRWMLNKRFSFDKSSNDVSLAFFLEYFYRILSVVEDRELQSILYAFSKTSKESSLTPREIVVILEKVAKEFNIIEGALPQSTKEALEECLANFGSYSPPYPISNFEDVDSYHCAACHPTDSHSLHMRPQISGENQAEDIFVFPKKCEGYNGIVHGGFLSMALDEVMVYAVVLHLKKVAVTIELTTQFFRPVVIGREYRIVGKIVDQSSSPIIIEGQILSEDGKVCAAARGSFVIPTVSVGARIFGKSLTDHAFARKFFLEDNNI